MNSLLSETLLRPLLLYELTKVIKPSRDTSPTKFFRILSGFFITPDPVSNSILSLLCSKNDVRVTPMNKPHGNKTLSKLALGKDQ